MNKMEFCPKLLRSKGLARSGLSSASADLFMMGFLPDTNIIVAALEPEEAQCSTRALFRACQRLEIEPVYEISITELDVSERSVDVLERLGGKVPGGILKAYPIDLPKEVRPVNFRWRLQIR